MPLSKCPDKNATIEFILKSTLVSANVTGAETLSMMSDALSNDSGPDSDFEFDDFLKEDKNDGKSALAAIRKRIRKPPTIIKTQIKGMEGKPPI